MQNESGSINNTTSMLPRRKKMLTILSARPNFWMPTYWTSSNVLRMKKLQNTAKKCGHSC